MCQEIASKVHSMTHSYNRDSIVRLTEKSPAYIVCVIEDEGRFVIGDTVEGEESTHADRMALENAICIRKKTYRNHMGAMEFWYK